MKKKKNYNNFFFNETHNNSLKDYQKGLTLVKTKFKAVNWFITINLSNNLKDFTTKDNKNFNFFCVELDLWLAQYKLKFDIGKPPIKYDKSIKTKFKNYKRLYWLRVYDEIFIGFICSQNDFKEFNNKFNSFIKDQHKLNITLTGKENYFLEVYLFKKKQSISNLCIIAPKFKMIKILQQYGIVNSKEIPCRCNFLIKKKPEFIVNFIFEIWTILKVYYNCVDNKKDIRYVFNCIKNSCALTLASKFGLSSKKKVFKKFGQNIKILDEQKKILASFPSNSIIKRRKIKDSPYNIIIKIIRIV